MIVIIIINHYYYCMILAIYYWRLCEYILYCSINTTNNHLPEDQPSSYNDK